MSDGYYLALRDIGGFLDGTSLISLDLDISFSCCELHIAFLLCTSV